MWSELRYRLRAIFRRRAMERELADELQFHLERQTDERPGRPRAEFGGIEQVKEACRDERGTGGVDRLSQDLRYAWRMFTRQPGFTIAVVTTLALGIGGATTMFALVDGVLLKPLAYEDADRIIRLGRSFGGVRVSATSATDYATLSSRSRTLSHVAVVRTEHADVAVASHPERLEAAAVSASFFGVLGVPPALGQALSPPDDRPGARSVAVISHGLWLRRFADASNPIGRTLLVNGQPYTVIGVMPKRFRGPEALGQDRVDLWLPLGHVRLSKDPDDAALGTLARLGPDADLAAVNVELGLIGGNSRFWTAPLLSETIGQTGSGLWLLFGAVSLLLVLACTNVASLFLVRATGRTREIAVRAALGAAGGRIARQLMTESLAFSLAGGIAGVALAIISVELIRAWSPAELPRVSDLQIDVRVLAFAFGAAVVAGTLFGIAPSLTARRADFAGILRGSADMNSGRSRQRARAALVIVQTALALMLVVGAGLLVNSVWRLSRVDPGFDASQVVWIDVTLPERSYPGASPKVAFFEEAQRRLSQSFGFHAVSVIQGRPLGGGNAVATIAPEGRLPVEGTPPARVPYHVVAPGYFDTMRIPRLDGRDFDANDRSDAGRVAIVSRAFAERFWPADRAVGKRFWMGRIAADAPLTEIVGVVEDVRQYALADAPIPVVYRAVSQVPRGAATIVAKHTGLGSTDAIDQIRSTIRTLDSALALDRAGTMDAQVWTSIREPRFRALALSAFGVIACVIACVGLYGSLAWLVRARSRELGVRLALGARTGTLRGMVIRRGLLIAATGIALGLAGAAASAQLVASLMFGITPLDPLTYAAGAMVMLTVALVACWLPAQRAGRINPIEVLRD